MNPEIQQLQERLSDLVSRVQTLENENKQLKQRLESQNYISFLQTRLRIRTPQVVDGSLFAKTLALSPYVATVTAVNGYTPIYDTNGVLLKVATLT